LILVIHPAMDAPVADLKPVPPRKKRRPIDLSKIDRLRRIPSRRSRGCWGCIPPRPQQCMGDLHLEAARRQQLLYDLRHQTIFDQTDRDV